MAVTLKELFESRELVTGEREGMTFHYVLEGTTDPDVAKAHVISATPMFYNMLKRGDIRLEPEFVDTDTDQGIWRVEIEYVEEEEREPETGDSSFTFETGGGTQHITQSIETMGAYAPTGQDADDCKGAIGFTGDGNVEGVDIRVPLYTWTETHYLPDSMITEAYRRTLFYLTGKTNAAPFKGCLPGECLFMGAAGSKRRAEDWEVTFRFAAQPNLENIQIGDITVQSKKGWEYLWVRYQEFEDKTLIPRPLAAYVEKVHYEGDFSELGIGT